MATPEESENLTTLQKVSDSLHISHWNINGYNNLDDEVALLQTVLQGEDRRLDAIQTEEDREW